VKLTEVISDILGTSGRAILTALVAGETDPERLADLTSGRLKATRTEWVEALHGRVTAHHRFILHLHLTQIAALDTAVADIEARIREALGPFRPAVSLLTTMPGVSETAAAVIVAEIGTDMSMFPSAGHLLSWAGLCPRLDESAGKRRSTRTRPGAPWLAAWAGSRQAWTLPATGINHTHRVFVVEGEKSVDRLWGLGLPATCPPNGAGRWRREWSVDLWQVGCREPCSQNHADGGGRSANCWGAMCRTSNA
jgi:Transposase IS116/IS110/IS902 family